MSREENASSDSGEAVAPPDRSAWTIFINYRHDDTSGYARALYQELKARFGTENVFIDAESILAGDRWLREIKARSGASGVFLALIGPDWLSMLSERGRSGSDDFVRVEIEDALKRGSATHVIPVVVDETPMPNREMLPWPSLRGLAEIQATRLRHSTWDDDFERLAQRIVGLSHAELAPPPEMPDPVAHEPRNQPGSPSPRAASAPDEHHFQDVARYLIDANRVFEPVVVFLGSGVNASDRGDERWQDRDCGWLPDADELAEHLARQFGLDPQPLDLAHVSQYVYLTEGGSPLYKTVRRILASEYPPTSVHRFLAGLPATIEELGYPERHQLIVTSNYDDALERAFDEANEAYDLVVYIASGDAKGKFLHIPHDDEPQLVDNPNDYRRFPIDAGDQIQLKRTVIVKIHGAIDAKGSPWRENYVMTEDQYIDYLVKGDVPIEIASQIKGSHCLFVGYTMRDWNLRVFLQRMWSGQSLKATSWAIERRPDEMERRFWNSLGIGLFAAPLDEYVRQLEGYLEALQKPVANT